MLDLSNGSKKLIKICNAISSRIEGSSVEREYGPYIYIPKLRVKIRIQNEELKSEIELSFSVVIDDVHNHFFKILCENVNVGTWVNDKISYIDYYVRGMLLDLYFKQCTYSDDYDLEFHKLLNDDCAFDIITS